MSEDKRIREVPPSRPADIEEHGVVFDVIVPVAAAAAGGATSAYVGHKLQQAKPPTSPPPESPPPSVELPPGVDRE